MRGRVAGAFLLPFAAAATPLSALAQDPPPPPSATAPADPDELIANTRRAVRPGRGCGAASGAAGTIEIVVCGSETDQHRLSPQERAAALAGREYRDTIPRAPEVNALHLDKLPYNWMGRRGVLFPRARPNPLLDHVRAMEAARAADAGSAPDP